MIQLMQLPVAILFGYLTDFAVYTVQGICYYTYWQQWGICLIGILLVAIGVSLEVKAGVVVLAGEGVVLAICKVLPKIKFGYMKVGFDVTLVVIACILSFVFTGRPAGSKRRYCGSSSVGRIDCETVWEAVGKVENRKIKKLAFTS